MLTWTTCVPKSIPPNLTATSSRPDIVYFNGQTSSFLNWQLVATPRKQWDRQESENSKTTLPRITTDLHRQGLNVKYDTVEIGALGHSTKDTPYQLYHTIPQVNWRQWQAILDSAGEIAIACSRSLFYARNALEWRQPPFVSLCRHQYPAPSMLQ